MTSIMMRVWERTVAPLTAVVVRLVIIKETTEVGGGAAALR